MKHTSEESIQKIKEGINAETKCNFPIEEPSAEYLPPQFAADRTIIISQEYLRAKHITLPKPKGKERLCEDIRGHHIWKGEWAVSEAGGLLYVDE